MKVVAIKFADGTYYSGCNKQNSRTLLGAQLYKSKKTAETMVQTSINFPKHYNNPIKIVDVELSEVEEESCEDGGILTGSERKVGWSSLENVREKVEMENKE